MTEPNQLPHSPRAEKSVLGAIFTRPDVFDGVDLEPGHFFDPRCRTVWEAFVALRSKRVALDVGTVEIELQTRKRFDAIGGFPFLAELLCDTPTADNVDHYAAVVRERATVRRVIEGASQIATVGRTGEVDGDELLARLAQLAAGIEPAKRYAVHDARSLARQRVSELAHALEGKSAGGNPLRIPTGLSTFDGAYGGLPRGTHSALVAPTGHGKTATAQHIALTTPVPALVFSFEELKRDGADRVLSARSGVAAIRITAGELNAAEFSRLVAVADEMPESVYSVNARGMTDRDVARMARRVVPALGVGVVVVDYLNRVRLSASPKLRTDERMREAVARFDDAAGELDVAWLTCAQVNRDYRKQNRVPRITDARECAALEEYSKLGIVVYRPNRDDDESTDDDDRIQIIVDKANIGEAPTVFEFGWHGPTMTIQTGRPK
jgi:replicative DNA helicase